MTAAKTFLGERKELFPMKSLITKRSQRIITILIALVLLLNCSTFTSAKQVEPDNGQLENESIIRADLREAMDLASEDELIPVWICLKSIDPDELDTMVLEKTGFDPKIYEDTALFNKYVLPEIEEAVKKGQRQDEDPLRNAADYVLAEIDPKQAKEGLIKKARRDRIEEYIQQKRKVMWDEYSRRNKEFLINVLNELDEVIIIDCSQFAPAIIIETTKLEIELLAQNDMIVSLNYFINQECKPAMFDALSQTGVYCQGGTGYEYPGVSSALTGSGLKIGVLESFEDGNGGKYDANAPQLSGNTNLHFLDNTYYGVPLTCDEGFHATEVMSIIAGQSIVYNGKTYCGVVPDATVYQVPVSDLHDYAFGLFLCLQYGVSVINASVSFETSGLYSYADWVTDYVVAENNAVVVASAGNQSGNSWKVTSPGMALNSIAVGNAETKTGTNIVLNSPYTIRSSSCYKEENYYPNKPDLVAPGCFSVLMKNPNNQEVYPEFCIGTSFSAPIVTGIAAQIIEDDPLCLHNPMMVKAKLLVGADLSQMDTSSDTPKNYTPSTPSVYDKCGAGMVNAINSVNEVYLEYSGQITNSTNTGIVYYFNAGDRIRAALTFRKNYSSYISPTTTLDDLDLILVKRDSVLGNYAFSYSLSYTNNNEIIDVTIPEDGEYYFNIYRRVLNDSSNPPSACVVYKLYT